MLSLLAFTFVIWVSMAEGLLFKPRGKCVPTAAVRGPCHQCICSTQGVYHCWHKKCDNSQIETPNFDKECEPLLTYIEKGTICSCNATGQWRSTNCRNRFRRLQANDIFTRQILRTNIPCTPYMLYLIDCNICRCEPDGMLKISSCTNRPCGAKHKAQTCRPGDIERFGNELCACSEMNYFIDILCFPVNEKEIQTVEDKKLEKLVYVDQTWRRNFVENFRCNQRIKFTVDCNQCVCKKDGLKCTNKVCEMVHNIDRSRKESSPKLLQVMSADQRCKPGRTYRFKCNTCVCADDGLPTCTNMVCLENFVLDLSRIRSVLKNLSPGVKPNLNTARTLSDIHEEEKCIPGQSYKMDCNTCFCNDDGRLLCTKALCLPQDARKKNDERVNLENVTKKTTPNKAEKVSSQIPNLPKKQCVPGEVYRKGCQICFCEDTKKAVCTNKKDACKQFKMGFRMHYLEDVRSPFQPSEVENLPELPQRQMKCKPGKSYKVDCNSCVCLSSLDLICDELICLSYDEMHRIDADEKSIGNCNPQTYTKTTEDCVECDCVKEKVKCNEVEGCISERDKQLPNWNDGKPKLTLDMYTEPCIPGAVYRMDCNNCYCQEDSTLRCTQKTCLNYSQAKELEKQRNYMIQNGL